MKRSERLLALFLALALVCGLLPTGIFAAEPGQQTSDVNLIPDGSFENSVDNDVTGQVSDKETGTVIWNGATPSSTWRHLFDNGKVIFEIVKDAAVAQDIPLMNGLSFGLNAIKTPSHPLPKKVTSIL